MPASSTWCFAKRRLVVMPRASETLSNFPARGQHCQLFIHCLWWQGPRFWTRLASRKLGLMFHSCFEGSAKGNHQRLHREGDALCHKISAQDFDLDDLTGFNRLVRVLDKAIGELGDMDESI